MKNIDINAVDSLGNTALMKATEGGHLKCVQALLAKRDTKVLIKNKAGLTALMMTAKDKPDIKELVERAEEKELRPKQKKR